MSQARFAMGRVLFSALLAFGPLCVAAAAQGTANTLRVSDGTAVPGGQVSLPVLLDLQPGNSVVTLQFNLTLEPQGLPPLDQPISFTTVLSTPPNLVLNNDNATILVGWLTPITPALSGETRLGTLKVTVPAGAPGGAYLINVIEPSGTSDGQTNVPIQPLPGHLTVVAAPTTTLVTTTSTSCSTTTTGTGTPTTTTTSSTATTSPPTTTVTTTTQVSTTTTTMPGCAQLPEDSLAGVECAIGAVRSTLNEPPQPTCTCKRCSLEPALDRLAGLVMQADAGTTAKKCKRKLGKARRAAKSLSARVASLNRRRCLAPVDRAASLDAEIADLARRTTALFKSGFCTSK